MAVQLRPDDSARFEMPREVEVLPLDSTLASRASAALSNAMRAAAGVSAALIQRVTDLTESAAEMAEPVLDAAAHARDQLHRAAVTVGHVVLRDAPQMAVETVIALPEQVMNAAASAFESRPPAPTPPRERIESDHPYFGDQ